MLIAKRKIVTATIAHGGIIAALLLLATVAGAQQPTLPRATDPSYATVRIKSHGISGTVIWTMQGRSWILTCAHGFLGKRDVPSPELRARRFVIEGVPPPPNRPSAWPRLVHWDHGRDLALIETEVGPLPCVPVAPKGYQPGVCWSCGFDEMKWPLTKRQTHILESDRKTTWTREMPWHGRSGGGLVDAQGVVLIGVVGGYAGTPGSMKGFYASHSAILEFLAVAWPKTNQQAAPRVQQQQDWRPVQPIPQVAPQMMPGPMFCPQ